MFSVDNGQMKVSHTGGGEAANDFTISLAFNDADGTADETFTSPTVIIAGVNALAALVQQRSSAVASETVAGFSAAALQFNAIAYGTGTVSTTTTGADVKPNHHY